MAGIKGDRARRHLVSRSFLLWREFCDDRPMSHYDSRLMFLSSRVFFPLALYLRITRKQTYCKLHLYFQLSENTWCLIGFHGNNSQINDVTGGRHLGFSNFQILFKFLLLYLRLTGKQHLAVAIQEIGRIHCEVVSI